MEMKKTKQPRHYTLAQLVNMADPNKIKTKTNTDVIANIAMFLSGAFVTISVISFVLYKLFH